MKGRIFMSQETIQVKLMANESNDDVLEFSFEEKPIIVNLNSSDSQNELKVVFAALLKEVVVADNVPKLEFVVNDNYSRVLYKEVCSEYISDLNKEVEEIYKKVKNEINPMIGAKLLKNKILDTSESD